MAGSRVDHRVNPVIVQRIGNRIGEQKERIGGQFPHLIPEASVAVTIIVVARQYGNTIALETGEGPRHPGNYFTGHLRPVKEIPGYQEDAALRLVGQFHQPLQRFIARLNQLPPHLFRVAAIAEGHPQVQIGGVKYFQRHDQASCRINFTAYFSITLFPRLQFSSGRLAASRGRLQSSLTQPRALSTARSQSR